MRFDASQLLEFSESELLVVNFLLGIQWIYRRTGIAYLGVVMVSLLSSTGKIPVTLRKT
jgi:hypothetical protein